jgi:hypothetical protein
MPLVQHLENLRFVRLCGFARCRAPAVRPPRTEYTLYECLEGVANLEGAHPLGTASDVPPVP